MTVRQISEVLPLLYLHGLSSQDFVPALQQFLAHPAPPRPTSTRHDQFSQRLHFTVHTLLGDDDLVAVGTRTRSLS